MTRPKSSKKPVSTVPQAIDDTDPMSSLISKLKAAKPEIQNYVAALEVENLKLQKQIAKLQAKNITLNNRINILAEEEFKPKLNIKLAQFDDHDTSKDLI